MFQPPTKCGHVMFFEIEYLHNRCEKWNGYMPLINQPVGEKNISTVVSLAYGPMLGMQESSAKIITSAAPSERIGTKPTFYKAPCRMICSNSCVEVAVFVSKCSCALANQSTITTLRQPIFS